MTHPSFPYDFHISEFDGVDIVCVAEDKSDWLDEDQLWDMEEAVNKLISQAKRKAGEEGYGDDIYDWFKDELKKIDSGLEMR